MPSRYRFLPHPFLTILVLVFLTLFCGLTSKATAVQTNGQVGDVSLDDNVDFLDIAPFVAVLSSGTYQFEADIDGNGEVNFLDISAFIVLLNSPPDPSNSKPNVVMIIVDDLGYADLSADHMPLTTALFQTRGTSLHLYGHQNCIPSRAALMTGMNPARFNQHAVFTLPVNEGVPTSIPLLPQYLKPAGYKTGAIGKWHLGWHAEQVPTVRGFDSFVGVLGGLINSYGSLPDGAAYPDGTVGHDHHTRHDMAENGVSFYTSKYSTHLFRDEAIEFIESNDPNGDPFFAYISFNAPHAPYHAPRAAFDAVKLEHGVTASDEAYLYTFADDVVGLLVGATVPNDVKDRLDKAIYYAMVKDLDGSVAAVWQALEDSGHSDDTMVLFASDNGGVLNLADNLPYRGAKGSPYDGGHFVANGIIAPWIEPGQVINTDIWMADIVPTILQLAGVDATTLELDGGSAVDAMTGNGEVVRKDGLTSFPCHIDKRYRPSTDEIKASGTIHGSNLKYIRFYTFASDGVTILSTVESFYDLSVDPAETRSLHRDSDYTEAFESMRNQFDCWIGDQKMSELREIHNIGAWAGFVFPDEWGDY